VRDTEISKETEDTSIRKIDLLTDRELLIFDTETSFQTWAKSLTIVMGLYLSIVLGPVLDKACPYPWLLFGLPAVFCAFCSFGWLGVREHYLFHLVRRELQSRIEAFSFHFSRPIAAFDDLLGVTVHSERFETRSEGAVVYYYQVVVALKDGRIFPLSRLAQEGLIDANELGSDYARQMQVDFVKSPGSACVEVINLENGRKAIFLRSYEYLHS